MKMFIPIIAAVSLAAGCIGCGGDPGPVAPVPVNVAPVPVKPQSPTSTPTPAPAPAPAPTVTNFPTLASPGTIYIGQSAASASEIAYHGSLISRYVIYDDGSFDLQYLSGKFGFFDYPGKYTQSGTSLTLNFRDSDVVGPWTATAALSGNQMSVKYNIFMGMADFDDGVYAR